ncbi:unnamed protein product [Brassica rapa subsp. narinosa]
MQASAPADVSETYLSSLLDDKFLRSLSDVRDVDEALKIVTIDLDPTAADLFRVDQMIMQVLPSEFSVNNESLSLVRALYFSPHVFKFSFLTGALEYEMGDAHMAIQARLNQALHKLNHSLYNTYHLYKSGIKLLRYMLLSSLRPGVRDQFIGG